jgi:hypothetical protein
MSQIVTTNYAEIAEEAVQGYIKASAKIMQDSQFVDILRANTDRVQGRLVLFGYELEGGTDTAMIQRAALAIELLRAYVQSMEQGVASDQALRAMHEAEILLANLEADPEYRLKAVSITNRTMMLATLARDPKTTEKDVIYWKTTELALNPLHVGQVLAGADCDRTNVVTSAALAYGEALLQGTTGDFDTFTSRLYALV